MHYGDDNTQVWDVDHDQELDVLARDLAWQEFMDWARGAEPYIVVSHLERFKRGQFDPYHGLIDARLDNFLLWHKESDLFYALAQIQREREREAA